MSAQAASLFIGMVTHARSRFNVDGAAIALANSLGNAARSRGLDAVVTVSDRDDYDVARYPLTHAELLRSAAYQARLEYRWRRYLAAATPDGLVERGRDVAVWGGMTVKRAAESVAPRPWRPAAELSGTRAAIRLINIDLSHLRLMDAAVAAGSDWALILEDDAGAVNPDAAVQEVIDVTTALDGTGAGFVNLSESIALGALGVEGILAPASDVEFASSAGRRLWRASRPVTNTVCANLYRADLLGLVRAEIERQGLLPVAPIDWRLNAAVMALHARGAVDDGTCLWLRPGVFTQRSMHGS